MVKRKRTVGRPALAAEKKKSRSITFKVRPAIADKLERASRAHANALSDELVDRIYAGESEEAWELAYDVVAALRLIGTWNDTEKQGEREMGWRIEAHEARKNPGKFGEPVELQEAKQRYESMYGGQAETIRDTLQIIIDAHTRREIPDNLLESKRYGATEARIAAWTILLHRNFARTEA